MNPPIDPEVTISEEDGIRYLHFGSEWIQGAMVIRRPDELMLDYVQSMMAWLLFLDPPAQILQLGLGAGSLTKFAHRFLAPSRITVVEIARQVHLAAQQWFALPPEGPRLQVSIDDAARFVARRAQRGRYGVIQVDLYDRDAAGPIHDSLEFYMDCRAALASAGIVVVNLFGQHHSFVPSLQRLYSAFDGRVLIMPPNPQGNAVLLGFSGPPIALERTALQQRAEWLEAKYRLPACRWAAGLRHPPGVDRGPNPAFVLNV